MTRARRCDGREAGSARAATKLTEPCGANAGPEPSRRVRHRRTPGGNTATSSPSARRCAARGSGSSPLTHTRDVREHRGEFVAVARARGVEQARRASAPRPASNVSARRPAASRAAANSRSSHHRAIDCSAACRRWCGPSGAPRAGRGSIGCAGHLVDAVAAVVEPLQRGLDLGELGFEPFEDRRDPSRARTCPTRCRPGAGRSARARRPDRPRRDRVLAAQLDDEAVDPLALGLEPPAGFVVVECVMPARYPCGDVPVIRRAVTRAMRARSSSASSPRSLEQHRALAPRSRRASSTRCASSGPSGAAAAISNTSRTGSSRRAAVRSCGTRSSSWCHSSSTSREGAGDRGRARRRPSLGAARARRAARPRRCGNGSSGSHRTTRNRRRPTVASA